MEQSILRSTKKVLGVGMSDTSFDEDIIMHINSALATLNQLGIGPEGGILVMDETATWAGLIGSDRRYSSAKSYIYAKTKLLFDPPTTGFLVDALKETIREMEWRLNTLRETQNFDSDEVVVDDDLDGGDVIPDLPASGAADGGAP